MAAADKQTKHTAADVAILEETIPKQKAEIEKLKRKLEDAVRYSLNQKQQLMAFLDYGDVPISNNLAKNAIRPFVVGRKTDCSVTVSREPSPAPLCIRWWKQQRPTALNPMNTFCWS